MFQQDLKIVALSQYFAFLVLVVYFIQTQFAVFYLYFLQHIWNVKYILPNSYIYIGV